MAKLTCVSTRWPILANMPLKRSTKPLSITEIVSVAYCEQKVIFDIERGRSETREVRLKREDGISRHKRFEAEGRRSQDRRCFIATAIWRNGKPTAPHGYLVVRARRTGKKLALKVDLGEDAYCERLIRRYLALREGSVKPTKVKDPRCNTCSHKGNC